MLIIAGYINFTINNKNALKIAEQMDSEQYAGLGDARLVSTNIVENKENQQDIEKLINQNEVIQENTSVETLAQQTDWENSQYFMQSKIDRENMYSQIIESYDKILENEKISEAQRAIAEQEIIKTNQRKNAVMIAENLIKNKGFQDVLIFINDKSINVILKAKELDAEQIAQIQNIIQRELQAEVEDIHISHK